MTGQTTVLAIMGALFPKSEKVVSEKLSTDEHATLTGEVTELNTRLEAQATANGLVVADLASANAKIEELNGSLTTAQSQISTLNAQIATVTADRDLFKGYHEKAAAAGDKKPGEDENSRKLTGGTAYNQHALSVWQKANA